MKFARQTDSQGAPSQGKMDNRVAAIRKQELKDEIDFSRKNFQIKKKLNEGVISNQLPPLAPKSMQQTDY